MLDATVRLYKTVTLEHLKEAVQSKHLRYDKAGEEHYNTVSAFIKSMRASQADAAIYYLARMIEAGEDPLFIARRMVIFASEDIGLAQPTALVVALAAPADTPVHFMEQFAEYEKSQVNLFWRCMFGKDGDGRRFNAPEQLNASVESALFTDPKEFPAKVTGDCVPKALKAAKNVNDFSPPAPEEYKTALDDYGKALAGSPVRFVGIENLRVKECDRIRAVSTGLNNIREGLAKEEGDDLLVFSDPSLAGQSLPAAIDTFADHRIAMSFALAGLKIDGVTILDPLCVGKTYPDYWKALASLSRASVMSAIT